MQSSSLSLYNSSNSSRQFPERKKEGEACPTVGTVVQCKKMLERVFSGEAETQ